ASDELPDSRKVVQGLLRSIPPPRSQPPASALNRLSTGKRHTVQLSARGSVVDGDYSVARAASQTRSTTLARSASTRTPAQPPHSQEEDARPAPVANPAENMNGSQTLGQSASTLRPSSDTFADEAHGSTRDRTALGDAQEEAEEEEEGSETAEADDVPPMSPASSTGTSDTASYIHESSDDRASLIAATTAAAAAAAASVTLAHRSLKDSASARTSLLSRTSVVSTASMAADRLSIVSLAAEELSLDDWLVILHGWSDMHDISASTTSFYQAFLKDMQAGDKDTGQREAQEYIQRHVAELQMAGSESQSAIDDILGVSQGVGRRLDSLERELDDIARILVHAN
ncbi:hypothetical protein GGI05_004874, partial [Coemansia sp. RSA 2603]